ncbi:MAG: hypothetical protein ACRC7O_13385, partial [Fimbriiglobus sp.]
LRRWPGLTRVETLALTDDYCGRLPAGLMLPLGHTRTLSAVRATTDADLDAFTATPGLEAVRDLTLWLLAESPEANVYHETITPAAIERLMLAPALLRLTRLTIGFYQMPERMAAVLRRLADSAVLPRLEAVTAQGYFTDVPDDAVAVARQRFGSRLRVG